MRIEKIQEFQLHSDYHQFHFISLFEIARQRRHDNFHNFQLFFSREIHWEMKTNWFSVVRDCETSFAVFLSDFNDNDSYDKDIRELFIFFASVSNCPEI